MNITNFRVYHNFNKRIIIFLINVVNKYTLRFLLYLIKSQERDSLKYLTAGFPYICRQ